MDPWIEIINVSLQGMFDLSRFMVGAGSGSDGEHEQGERSPLPLQQSGDVPSLKHEEGEWFKALRQDNTKTKSPEPEKDIEASDWSDCEEASGAVTNKLTESKFQDEEPEASCWSDGGDSYKLIENQAPIRLDKQDSLQQNDTDSPVWSEDDLQSWSNNNKIKNLLGPLVLSIALPWSCSDSVLLVLICCSATVLVCCSDTVLQFYCAIVLQC